MANFSGTVIGKGRAYQDAVDALHTNQSLTDRQKRGIMDGLSDVMRVIEGQHTHSDKTLTGTWTMFTGANPSCSVSITT